MSDGAGSGRGSVEVAAEGDADLPMYSVAGDEPYDSDVAGAAGEYSA